MVTYASLCREAAEILGMSERTFRRWRDRFQAGGLKGLADRRLGNASARRLPIDPVHAVLTLDRERYRGFTARHFHDKLRQHGEFALGYPWTELRLQAAGLVPKAERRSEHRKKRARRPLRGMRQGQRGTAIPVAPAHALHSRVSPALAMLPAAAPGVVPNPGAVRPESQNASSARPASEPALQAAPDARRGELVGRALAAPTWAGGGLDDGGRRATRVARGA
jgi:transposase